MSSSIYLGSVLGTSLTGSGFGTTNQVLTSTGSNISWKTKVITNNNILLPVSPVVYADSNITPILTYAGTYGRLRWLGIHQCCC
jgi:hypothetical protein